LEDHRSIFVQKFYLAKTSLPAEDSLKLKKPPKNQLCFLMFRCFEIKNRKIRAIDVKKQTMFGFLLFDKKLFLKTPP
jgi:hypothetical protein